MDNSRGIAGQIEKLKQILPALPDLTEKWESVKCGICGDDKWRCSPACRRCSRRVKRVLFREYQFVTFFVGRTVIEITQRSRSTLRWYGDYDRMLDYLGCTHRERRPKHEEDSE